MKKLREIKSYVQRGRSLSKLQQETWDKALASGYLFDLFEKSEEKISSLLHDKKTKILEIGFGNGDAILEMALANPDTNFVGIEVYKLGISGLLSKIFALNINNLNLVYGDVKLFLQNFVTNNCFQRVHIFFPDPWPKFRHKKRRLVNNNFLNFLVTKIEQNGIIHFISDCEDYVIEIKDNFQSDSLKLLDSSTNISMLSCKTKFQKKGEAKNFKISELFFQKI